MTLVELFTKEWKDKRWRACRFGTDLRTCGTKCRLSDVGYPVCERDGKTCDARWTGPKE